MLLVNSWLLTDADIRLYFDELFERPEIQEQLLKWGEVYNREHTLQVVRQLQKQEALCVFAHYGGKPVGNILAFKAPSLYSLSTYAMEVSLGALPNAPMKTLLVLHKALAKWAQAQECKFIQVTEGPYTPEAYSRVLTKLGFTRLGGTYMKEV